MSLSINLSPGLLLFLRFPLPGYSMPMGINLSSAFATCFLRGSADFPNLSVFLEGISMFFLFLRFPLPGYGMPMGINLSSALPLDQQWVNSLNVQSC